MDKHEIMRVSRWTSGAFVAVTMLFWAGTSYATLSKDGCYSIAEAAAGVYDLSIKNGNSKADAKKSAENVFRRKVGQESGPTSPTMKDALDDCRAVGAGFSSMCRRISNFYSPPC